MDFPHALAECLAGKRITNLNWNGPNQCVFMMPGYPNGVPANETLSAASGILEGDIVTVAPYLNMMNSKGVLAPWLISQYDVFSDWAVLSDDSSEIPKAQGPVFDLSDVCTGSCAESLMTILNAGVRTKRTPVSAPLTEERVKPLTHEDPDGKKECKSLKILRMAEEWVKRNPNKNPDVRHRYLVQTPDDSVVYIDCFTYQETEWLHSRRHVFYNCGGGEIASFSGDFKVKLI